MIPAHKAGIVFFPHFAYHKETSAKVYFRAKFQCFEAKNRKSDDVYTEYKRRSFYDFVAEAVKL